MSSALRRIAQIAPTIKFLRAVNPDSVEDAAVYNIVTNANMTTFLENDVVVNIESSTGINTVVVSNSVPSTTNYTGTLVRDMGRRVTVTLDAAGNPLRQVWIQVQAVNGPTTGGVPPDYPTTGSFWVCTWCDRADDFDIQWVRTG